MRGKIAKEYIDMLTNVNFWNTWNSCNTWNHWNLCKLDLRGFSFVVPHLRSSKLDAGVKQQTVATFVTTVAVFIGGEDKIRTCGRVTPTAV